jgi:predicted RNA polymerase sigma factor
MGPSEHLGDQLGDHLFRRESGRIVATLTRIFGVHNLALAEDVVQDAFCRALEVWKFHGVPENPSAWLMATAKNRALDTLFDQDRSRWDSRLVADGQRFLDLSATGSELTEYHVEAAIASVHAMAHRTEETDWGKIVSLYDTLMTIRPSPAVALNRAIAIGQHEGPNAGSKRFVRSPIPLGLPPIRSTRPRSASSNSAAGDPRSPANTSERRSL